MSEQPISSIAGDPPSLHGFTLLPVTCGLTAMLERINSPLLKLARLAASNPGKTSAEFMALAKELPQPEPEADIETIFCFLHAPPDLRKILGQGRTAFREAVMQELGDVLHPAQISDLALACGRHFASSFAVMRQPSTHDPQETNG